MDNRLIFLYLNCFVISWGETEFDMSGVIMIRRLNYESVTIGKSVVMTVNSDEKT